jgi:streptomycin 6-kinase
MSKKPKNESTKAAKKAQQTRIPGTERLHRNKELEEAAEEFRVARDKRMAATKVESEKKSLLKAVVKKHGLVESYFYDDEDGDTEEVKPIIETVEDVKVNKVKQAKAKADE